MYLISRKQFFCDERVQREHPLCLYQEYKDADEHLNNDNNKSREAVLFRGHTNDT